MHYTYEIQFSHHRQQSVTYLPPLWVTYTAIAIILGSFVGGQLSKEYPIQRIFLQRGNQEICKNSFFKKNLSAITFCCEGKESCNPDSFVVISRCANIHLEHLDRTIIYESSDGCIRIGSSGPLLSWWHWQVHLPDVLVHGPDIGFRCRHDMMRVVIVKVEAASSYNPRFCI